MDKSVDERLDETRRDLRSQHHWIFSEPNAFTGKIVHPMLLARSSDMSNIDDLESVSGFVQSQEQTDYGNERGHAQVTVAT